MCAEHTLPLPESPLHSLPLPARRLHECLAAWLTTSDESSRAVSTSAPRPLLASLPPVEPPAARAVHVLGLCVKYLPQGGVSPD